MRGTKHIKMHYPSLAEAYAHLRSLITVWDLGHEAKIMIDINLDSPFNDSYIHIPSVIKKIEDEKEKEKNI